MVRGDRRYRTWFHGILFHRRGRERQSSHRLYAGAGQPAHALRALGRNSLDHGGRDRAGGDCFPLRSLWIRRASRTWSTPRVAGRRSITLCARAGLGASRRSRSSRDKLWPRHSSSTLSIGRTWLTTSSWRWAFNTRRGRQLAGPRVLSTPGQRWDPSIVLDANGAPHIAYYDADNGALLYASLVADKWCGRVIDDDPSELVRIGRDAGLVLDHNGRAHISYHSHRKGEPCKVKYAVSTTIPSGGSWTVTGSLNTARYFHTATLLPSGVPLVAGGQDSAGIPSASAELYDDAGSGSWTATGSLNTARVFHTATLLPNGIVLVAGGQDSSFTPSPSAELYDSASGSWTATGNLNTARFFHTATLLPNGMVLVAAGCDSSFTPS